MDISTTSTDVPAEVMATDHMHNLVDNITFHESFNENAANPPAQHNISAR